MHPKQTPATSRRDHCRRATGFQDWKEHHRQIFNLRILCEKYLHHQQNLYHVFIDFKKAIDRVWHEALWATMRKYNINANIIRVIESLYHKAQCAVLFTGSIGDWFRTTVGVRQREGFGCNTCRSLVSTSPLGTLFDRSWARCSCRNSKELFLLFYSICKYMRLVSGIDEYVTLTSFSPRIWHI